MKWHLRIPYSPSLSKSSFTAINGVGAWAFMPLSYARDSGAARIWGEGVGEGVLENSCMKTAFCCTLNAIIKGRRRVCEVAYTNPLLPILRISFTPINEVGGHGAFVPLRYASDSGAARICQWV